MPDSSSIPVLFLAFANNQDDPMGYLHSLPEEVRQLRAALEPAQASGLCEVVVQENATVDEVLQVFYDPKYRHRIALFHYGGHANAYQLLLETADGKPAAAHAVGIAEFFGQQRGLEVIFLNGCSTEPQVQDLLDEGISVVIATSQAIDDKVASEFSTCFYQSIATGSAISTAFAEAVGAVKIPRGNETRNFYYVGTQPEVADRWPWTLHLRPGAEEMAQWNLPAVVDNQLFGLPALPKLALPASPYRYLDWYRREDAELFFGRGHDIRSLYNSLTATDSPPITLFYGQSGVGKSSLLAAGLLPRLEQSHTLVYLRRDPAKGLLGTLISPPSPLRSTGSQLRWRDVEAQAKKPLLVVLDQVEEYRTRPNPTLPQEMEQLLAALQELFGDPTQRPQGKLLLSFRKEWLAEIEKQLTEAKLPHAKVYLKRLDRRGILDVIMGPTRIARLQDQYHLTVEEGLAELIADDLLADQEAAVAPTLQILLTRLWERATAQSDESPHFDGELYDRLRDEGLGLDDFLDHQLDSLRQIETAVVDSGLALDLLVFHTTEHGTAGQHAASELRAAYHHQEAIIANLVRQCQALYLLTDPAQGEPGSEPVTRLAHDTLAPLVRARYETSDAPGQRARRILESRVVHKNGNGKNGNDKTDNDKQSLNQNGSNQNGSNQNGSNQNGNDQKLHDESQNKADSVPLDLLADADLALVEAGRDGMRIWDSEEQELVELSRKAREKRQRQNRFIRRAFVALAFVILIAVGFALLASMQSAANQSRRAVAESLRQSTEALQLLEVDPVKSISTSLDALPSPAHVRPYVPEAEFALYQGLRSNLEQAYLPATDPPLTEEQVAFAEEWIAAGKDSLRLIPYDLSGDGVITLAQYPKKITGVAWNGQNDALLAWNEETVQVWLGPEQSFEPTFVVKDAADGEAETEAVGRELIGCARWSPSGKQIAICRGEVLWLWSYETGEMQRGDVFTSTRAIVDTRWSPNGKWLAVWNQAYAFSLWDGQRLLPLETPPQASIDDVGWSADGEHLVATFADATALIWSLAKPQEPQPLLLESEASGNQYRIEFVDESKFLTWTTDPGHRAQLWSVVPPLDGNYRPIHEFGRELDDLQDVKFSPDQPWVLTLLGDGIIRGWSLRTGKQIFDLQGHTEPIQSIDWYDQSRYLATSSNDGTARVWDTRSGEPLMTLRGHTNPSNADVQNIPLWVHWHEDGQHLFTYGQDGTIRLWRVFDDLGYPLCEGMDDCYGFSQRLSEVVTTTEIITHTEVAPTTKVITRTTSTATALKIKSARWLSDNIILASDKNGNALRWQLPDPGGEGSPQLTGTGAQPGRGSTAAWSPNGAWVFRYPDEKGGTLWEFSTQTSLAVPGPVAFAKWLNTGLLVGQDSGSARLYRIDSGSPQEWPAPAGHQRAISAAQEYGDWLATGDRSGLILISDYQEVDQQAGTLPFTRTLVNESVDGWSVQEIEWSPDGGSLLARYSSRGTHKVALWDVEKGEMRTGPAGWADARAAAFSPDGQYVAVASQRYFRIFDTQTGVESRLVLGHLVLINGIEWVEARQWPDQPVESFAGSLLRRFMREPSINPMTRWLILTWSGDGTVSVWQWGDINDPAVEIARMSNSDGLDLYDLNPTGSRLLSVDPNGSLRVWRMWLNEPEALRLVAEESLQHRMND
ncbi:MAG: CHAT domain-containing protein [Caldilineaceae bacterium]|nr:CHAT domain-containing protein [Caldilineaceae bacterium]